MSKQTNPGIRLGILGGGQLARMLALSAHNMGLQPHVLSENSLDPAQQVTRFNHVGSLKDLKVVQNFLQQVDLATFESEFLDGPLLLQAQHKSKTPIFPHVSTMELLQDRLTQKQNLDLFKLPTAPWLAVNSAPEALSAAEQLRLPLVFKKRRFGYDGYGTFVIKTKSQLVTFTKNQFPSEYGFIAEKWIPFRRELACVFARNLDGETSHYPLVESFQKESRCFWVRGPIQHKKFSSLARQFEVLLKKMKYVGVIGVELFETASGLLVNELAPRVHNSAHYTMTAFSVSQFDLHIKALLNQSVKIPPMNAKAFAMVNLLGGSSANKTKWTLASDIDLHWYGKLDNR
ncbi:ATP-grasp domain-containing protein, partial [bacterium]|nr:ATP-grasp domain-containing protein [bacterium]